VGAKCLKIFVYHIKLCGYFKVWFIILKKIKKTLDIHNALRHIPRHDATRYKNGIQALKQKSKEKINKKTYQEGKKMTTKNANKKTTGKKTTRKSKFYTMNVVKDMKNSLSDTAKEINQKLIQKPIRNGKDFLQDLKKSPRKTIDTLIDDSKEFIEDTKKDARKKIDAYVKDGKTFAKKAQKNPRKTITSLFDDGKGYIKDLKADTRKKVDNYFEDGKELLQKVEKDARLIVEDLLETGKKSIDKIPGKKSIEINLEKRVKAIPNTLNLPSKKDIENLNQSMKALNKKVETLSSQYAA
jgi:hypothetical protein